jgi:protocatechuate 3,4-dioxygenase beta subunit
VVRPELTEGPYFVDGQLNRADIRIDPSDNSIKEGLPLRLTFRVMDVTGGVCAPLQGAQVDVWHCDALGVYSGVQDPGFDTSSQLWLRGYQLTDEDGIAEFMTIYPGWYSGRAVHIHFKIRTDPEDAQGYEFTSQFFFPEAINDLVHAEPPYASKGYRNVLNDEDGIFQQSDGLLTLDVIPFEDDEDSGYAATFDIGLDLSDASVGADDGGMGFGGGRRGGRP